jgi:NAD(P)-dependent dehydrogenase (short-subunit alcohol dehydrogenase family)
MKDQTIFITGASGGLGSALAKTCAARGATVVLHGKTPAKLDMVFDAIEDAGHPEPYLMPLDFEKAAVDSFRTIADAVMKERGRCDALIHCAATLGAVSPIEQQTVEHLRATWLVNAFAPMMLTRALAPALRAASSPAIVFVTDSHVKAPGPFWGGYGVSKAAIDHFAKMLSKEWDFARIHAFEPGAIDSPMRQKTHPGESKNTRRSLDSVVAEIIGLIEP